MLKPGDRAPDITLPDQHGRPFRLADLRGRKNAVLFFYPRADSAVCTLEACAFRDSHEAFDAADTEVIGISSDAQDEQYRFAVKRRLPYTLLCDTDGVALRAFDVGKWLGLIKNRVTFVIDKQGLVTAAIEGRFLADHHVREALKALGQRRP